MKIKELRELIAESVENNKIINSHPNYIADPQTASYWIECNWAPMVEILKEDYNECVAFMDGCSEEEIEVLSPIFEELSYAFRKQEFIDFIKKLQQKYPNLDMSVDIEYAMKSMNL